MIVHQQDGTGVGDDRRPEDLTWMHKYGIERACGDEDMAQDPTPRIEQQDKHALGVGAVSRMMDDVGAPVGGGLVGLIAEYHVLWAGAFAQTYKLVFFRGVRRHGPEVAIPKIKPGMSAAISGRIH